MTENERVKEMRKAKGLTLEKFGERVGVTRGAMSAIENGHRSVTDQMRRSICREFGVREEWLRAGEGPMDAAEDAVNLDDLVKGAGLEGREADTIKKMVQIFCSLKAETRRDILSRFDEYFGGDAPGNTPEERARKRANDFYEEALAEEQAAAVPSASQLTDEKEA